MNKFIKIFTMFFLITFSTTIYADAPAPVNLSLKGIVDWIRLFQFVEYGTTLPSTPSTRGVWFILWVNNEPALYWSNGSEWIPFVASGIQDGSVDVDALVDGAVTTPKLADNSVTTNKIVNYAVTTNKIADNAVTGTKFANNSINTAKLAPYAVTNEKLGYLSVGTLNLQNGAVTSDKIDSTISDKSIVLNNGTVLNPSLSFHSDEFSGLSYDSASSTIDVSIGASDKIKIGSDFINFNNIPNGLTISSASEKIVLQSNGLHYDDISLTFNDNILASGSLLPSENLTFNLGNLDNKWNNLYSDNIFSENAIITDSQVNNLKINDGTIYPLTDNTGEIGTDSFKFKSGNFYELKSDNIIISNASFTNTLQANTAIFTNIQQTGDYSFFNYIFANNFESDKIRTTEAEVNKLTITTSGSILPAIDKVVDIGSDEKRFSVVKTEVVDTNQLKFKNSNVLLSAGGEALVIQNSIIPNNNPNLGSEGNKWNNFYVNNITSSNITNEENITTNNLSVNNTTTLKDLNVNGTANVNSLLVNGNPITSGIENLKFPRGTLSVDVDCGKYSLRSLGKDLVLFSEAFKMIDYNVTDDGNYFTFKSGAILPVKIVMDKPITRLNTLSIRLNCENITLDDNLHYLLSIQNNNGDFVTSFYNKNRRFYISFFNGNERVIDIDETEYDWNSEKNIYLILDFTSRLYLRWKMNIDGEDVYEQQIVSVPANTDGYIDINNINIGDGNNGTYSISQDFNAKYRRIQIYPYELNLKEMLSIPLLEPIVDQQRELSKNMTRCPYYTLGEPSTLIGGDFNEGEGFFGEVSGDKFIYPWEVLGQLWGMDMNVIDTKEKFIDSFVSVFGSDISYTFTGDSYTELGISDNLEVEWLKFYDHGYLIFIPKRPLLNNITWQEINNVLGGSEGKEIQIPVNRINPNQITYANKKSVGLVCRMINGGNLQPMIIGNINERGLENNNLCMGSEWNRLIYRICNQIPSDTLTGTIQGYSGGKQLGENWFNYTGNILGFGASNDLGRVSWCKEYGWYQNNFHCCRRGAETGVAHLSSDTRSVRSNITGFRPALVLKVSNQ